MTIKRKRNKPKKKLPAIVIVPDKSYTDDKGNLTPADIILITDLTVYTKIRMSLTDMAKRQTDDKSISQKGNVKK